MTDDVVFISRQPNGGYSGSGEAFAMICRHFEEYERNDNRHILTCTDCDEGSGLAFAEYHSTDPDSVRENPELLDSIYSEVVIVYMSMMSARQPSSTVFGATASTTSMRETDSEHSVMYRIEGFEPPTGYGDLYDPWNLTITLLYWDASDIFSRECGLGKQSVRLGCDKALAQSSETA